MERVVHSEKLGSDLIGPSKVRLSIREYLTRYPVQASIGTRTMQKQTGGKPTRGKAPPGLEITQDLYEK